MYYLYTLYNNNWVNILPKSNNLSWSNDEDTLSVELSFESIYDLPEGTHAVLKNENNQVFQGILVKKSKKKFVNSYTCFDMGFYLNKNELIKQFNNISASNVITQLCNDLGINSDITNISTNINKIYKDQSAASIIDDILEQSQNELGIKYVKEIEGYTLKIRPLTDLKITPKILIGKDIAVNSSIETMKNSVLVVSGDDENLSLEATAKDTQNIAKYGLLQEVISIDADNISQARNVASNYLSENNKIFKDTSLNLVAISGGDDIKANRLIEINIPSMGLNGWYKIKSASHNLTNNHHKVDITLEWGE
jgi:hypothetical protein